MMAFGVRLYPRQDGIVNWTGPISVEVLTKDKEGFLFDNDDRLHIGMELFFLASSR